MIGRWAALLRALLGLLLVAWIGLLGGSAEAAEPKPASVRRFALLVGANDGGTERELLHYAATDAELLGKALTELGGVERGDQVVLVDPSVAELEQGFRTIQDKITKAKASGTRIQLFFYYSGHSDETGLLLGGVHVDYKRLRGLIDKVSADVRIGVLDSCSSGAFTRFKGGKKQAPFVLGPAAEVEGHAYLTSSSADEAAQESDRVGGSFFTHFLVTGLRGAADFDGDRQVTLNEAYRFAFDETLARTETTAGGPQHAAYDIQLAGTGDLIMTDLRKTSAKLEIAGDVSGRLYVRDRRGKLAAELFKPKDGGSITLALEPGHYAVTIDDGRKLHRAEVEVRSNKTATLEFALLRGVEIEDTRARGGGRAGDRGERDRGEGDRDSTRPEPPRGGYTRVPFNIGVAPGAEINRTWARTGIVNNVSISFGVTSVAGFDGIQAALGVARTRDYSRGIQAAVGAAIANHDAEGIQAALGGSWAAAHMRGAQLGFGLNYAGELAGIQLGVVNIADTARGVQLGAVNATRGKIQGVQIGLVNYADEADASIGLIPITKQGGVWVDLWTSDVQLLNLGVKFRARKTYTLLTAGLHPIGGDRSKSWSLGFGFGGPLIARQRFWLELDNVVGIANPGGFAVTRVPLVLDSLRLSVGYRPVRHFAVWAALTANAQVDIANDGTRYRAGYAWATQVAAPTTQQPAVELWPGFAVGFEF